MAGGMSMAKRGASGVKKRDIEALKALASGQLPPGTPAAGLPRLRFDRVAQRVARSLQQALAGVAPETAALVVTVSAPIRYPGRMVTELCARLDRSRNKVFDETVCGNRVRARTISGGGRGGPRVIVFVHNPVPAPTGLFEVVKEALSAPRWNT